MPSKKRKDVCKWCGEETCENPAECDKAIYEIECEEDRARQQREAEERYYEVCYGWDK
jgi:hypothetical protein